jgi:hypothetical protein
VYAHRYVCPCFFYMLWSLSLYSVYIPLCLSFSFKLLADRHCYVCSFVSFSPLLSLIQCVSVSLCHYCPFSSQSFIPSVPARPSLSPTSTLLFVSSHTSFTHFTHLHGSVASTANSLFRSDANGKKWKAH